MAFFSSTSKMRVTSQKMPLCSCYKIKNTEKGEHYIILSLHTVTWQKL